MTTYSPLSSLPGLYSQTMGNKAANPASNITPPKNTLTSSQTANGLMGNPFAPKLGGMLNTTLGTTTPAINTGKPAYATINTSTPQTAGAGTTTNNAPSWLNSIGGAIGSALNGTFGSTPAQASTTNTNQNSSGTNTSAQNTGTIPLAGGGVTTSAGGYAGNPANNPNYTAPTSTNSAVTTPTAPITPGASNGTPASGNNNSVMTPGGGFTTAGTTQTNIPASQTVGSNGVIGGNNGLFGNAITNLSNTQPSTGVTTAQTNLNNQATGNNPAQTNIDTLTGIGQNQTPAVTGAYGALANFNQADPLTKSAQANLPMAALISSGRGQILGNQLAGVQQGLANTYNAAVTGQNSQVSAANDAGSQQLTGQNQQIGAANDAGSLANTAQSNQIGAQNDVLSTPGGQLSSYGMMGGGNLNPQNQSQSLAQQVVNGSISYSDALAGMGYAGQAGTTMLQNAIQGISPGFNYNTAQGKSAAQQTNATTGGTAATTAGAQAYINQYPQVQNLNNALNNITSLGTMTVQNAQGNNINPFSAAPANATLASIKSNLSDTGQVTFNSNMAQLQSAIQNLYSNSGGNTPTNITNAIGQMADGSLSVSGLQALLSAAQAEGKSLLANATATAASEYQQSQGKSNSSSGSTSGFGWNVN